MAFKFCATFNRAINRPKADPRIFFFSNLFINGQAFIISEKKILFYYLLCKGVQGKRRTNYYQSAVPITSPLKTITDPLKEIKIVKTDLKKVPSKKNSFCSFLYVQLPNFLRKKISHFIIILRLLISGQLVKLLNVTGNILVGAAS